MGLRSMQQNLQKQNEQESSLITDLTEANSILQQQLQEKQQEISNLQQENNNLTDKLAEAYKRIEKLANSDLELAKAQQLRQSAEENLEKSRSLMSNAKNLQQQNEQQSRHLQSREQKLKEQQTQLREKESSLQSLIEDAKKQAEADAAAALADGWKELEKAKDKANKEADDNRQQAEDLKAEAQKELESTKKITAEAQEKGYHDTVSTYRLAIYAMMLFCVVLGLVEIYKHWYIFEVYYNWCIEFNAAYGNVAAAGVAVSILGAFAGAYFLPIQDDDGQYLGLTIRLILLVLLFALADTIKADNAAKILLASCLVVGLIRWRMPKQ